MIIKQIKVEIVMSLTFFLKLRAIQNSESMSEMDQAATAHLCIVGSDPHS